MRPEEVAGHMSRDGRVVCSLKHALELDSQSGDYWAPISQALADQWHSEMIEEILTELEYMDETGRERVTLGLVPEDFAELMAQVPCDRCGMRLESEREMA